MIKASQKQLRNFETKTLLLTHQLSRPQQDRVCTEKRDKLRSLITTRQAPPVCTGSTALFISGLAGANRVHTSASVFKLKKKILDILIQNMFFIDNEII